MSTFVVTIGRRYFVEWESPAVWIESIHPEEAKEFSQRDRAENVARFVGGRVAERV